MDEKRILIVDANSADGEQIASFCREFNFKVATLDRGQWVMDAVKSDRPDLMIVSIALPDENGFSLCRKIRAETPLKKIPIILIGGEEDQEAVEQHRKQRDPANAYLYKPVDQDELIDQIEILVGLPSPPLSPSQDRAFHKAEKVKTVLTKAKSQIEDQHRSQTHLSKSLNEKAREVDMLRESYDTIKRKLEEAHERNEFLQEELTKSEQRILSLREESEGRAVQMEAQLKALKERHERELSEGVNQSEALVAQIENLSLEIVDLKKNLEGSERRNHLLEQENVQRENGLKERIKELLARIDEATQAESQMRHALDHASQNQSAELTRIQEEMTVLDTEKVKMEQRVIKAYKKIKMDQLRDEKLQKALEVALTLLKS